MSLGRNALDNDWLELSSPTEEDNAVEQDWTDVEAAAEPVDADEWTDLLSETMQQTQAQNKEAMAPAVAPVTEFVAPLAPVFIPEPKELASVSVPAVEVTQSDFPKIETSVASESFRDLYPEVKLSVDVTLANSPLNAEKTVTSPVAGSEYDAGTEVSFSPKVTTPTSPDVVVERKADNHQLVLVSNHDVAPRMIPRVGFFAESPKQKHNFAELFAQHSQENLKNYLEEYAAAMMALQTMAKGSSLNSMMTCFFVLSPRRTGDLLFDFFRDEAEVEPIFTHKFS